MHAERWRHTRGCGRFFNALRDTTTDHFLATYKVGEARPDVAAKRTVNTGLRTASGGRIERETRRALSLRRA